MYKRRRRFRVSDLTIEQTLSSLNKLYTTHPLDIRSSIAVYALRTETESSLCVWVIARLLDVIYGKCVNHNGNTSGIIPKRYFVEIVARHLNIDLKTARRAVRKAEVFEYIKTHTINQNYYQITSDFNLSLAAALDINNHYKFHEKNELPYLNGVSDSFIKDHIQFTMKDPKFIGRLTSKKIKQLSPETFLSGDKILKLQPDYIYSRNSSRETSALLYQIVTVSYSNNSTARSQHAFLIARNRSTLLRYSSILKKLKKGYFSERGIYYAIDSILHGPEDPLTKAIVFQQAACRYRTGHNKAYRQPERVKWDDCSKQYIIQIRTGHKYNFDKQFKIIDATSDVKSILSCLDDSRNAQNESLQHQQRWVSKLDKTSDLESAEIVKYNVKFIGEVFNDTDILDWIQNYIPLEHINTSVKPEIYALKDINYTKNERSAAIKNHCVVPISRGLSIPLA